MLLGRRAGGSCARIIAAGARAVVTRRRTLWFGWMLAVLAAAGFARLGFWQLERAADKTRMLAAVQDVLSVRAARPLAVAGEAARARGYDWAAGRGRFDDRPPLLLDNQQRGGRVGVRVYRIFVPDTAPAPLLVDLGWLPLAGDRTLPAAPRPEGPQTVRGLLAPPPSSGLALGAAMARSDGAWLLTRVDLEAIARETGLSVPLAPRVLRLDPALPLGYARDLDVLPNTLPPEKHRGYALQWFALATTVLVIAVVLTYRSSHR